MINEKYNNPMYKSYVTSFKKKKTYVTKNLVQIGYNLYKYKTNSKLYNNKNILIIIKMNFIFLFFNKISTIVQIKNNYAQGWQ